MHAIWSGLGFGFGLIVAIGAQNAFVLRQGLRREHIGLVVAVCTGSDLVLIAVGTAGVGALVSANAAVLAVVSVLGAAVLLVYGGLALRRAIRPTGLAAQTGGPPVPAGRVLGTTLALTWLNPHVYLDTVVLLGSVSAGYGAGRWWFALGACCASILWFSGLGFGARLAGPLFARPAAWRVLDVVIAGVMATIAVGLLVDLR
ncbi:LysE/ArgO family amino acid transporter [Cellulomonas citrea]|uniref:LysE/ArgO family amino acid transporter n=1 Tax=Cellulomonas citrea TaxID=1909423 RepID=UPI0013589830|nr:LysE/ArgO family amino acid transporter [Cellulomonas citrea]